MAASHQKTFTTSDQSMTCQTWFLMKMTPLWLLLACPTLPHPLNQEVMEELIMNVADHKGMSQTIVIIPTVTGTTERFIKQ